MSTITIPYNFTPRPYQLDLFKAMDSGFKRAVAVYHRRAGKDKALFNLIVKKAFERKGVYYYLFPEFAQGKRVIWDGIDGSGFKFMDHIPDQFIQSKNGTDMKVELTTGSIIQIIGTDKFNKVRGANPVGCVFSEFAFQNPKAWNIIRPILRENSGWAAFNSCVVGDTQILNREGLVEIGRESNPGFTDIDEEYFGLDNSFHKATHYFNSGKVPTLKVETSAGYSLEGSLDHKVWNGKEWVKLEDLSEGSTIAIQRDMQVFSDHWPKLKELTCRNSDNKKRFIEENKVKLSKDFIYECGLILGDGYVNFKGNYIVVTTNDDETREFLENRGYLNEGDNLHYRCCNKAKVQTLSDLGFTQCLAKHKQIPKEILSSNKEVQSIFLSGLFDSDGCSYKGRVSFTSASPKMILQLQSILLNFGIVTSKNTQTRPPSKIVNVWSTASTLEAGGFNAYLYFNQIGFRLTRKQNNISFLKGKQLEFYNDCLEFKGKNITYNTLKKNHPDCKELVDLFFYTKVSKISEGFADVYDFVIPDTHSFFSNGFISHNTTNGKNHFYDLYNMAKKNNAWFTQYVTVDDSRDNDGKRVITPEDIQEERDSGMSEEMVQQEFYLSWIANSQGFYYLQYIENAQKEGRITSVPFTPSATVETWWDIGAGDKTAIWFTQTMGKQIHIIDFMQNSGKGLDFYAKALQKKNYVYRSHNFPHDIRNIEFGSGRTRYEVAEELFKGTRLNIIQKISREDGINAARIVLPQCVFDRKKCAEGLDALRNYHREYDEKRQEYKETPVHDWASDPADAFRYMATGITMPRTRSFRNEFMKKSIRVNNKNWKTA